MTPSRSIAAWALIVTDYALLAALSAPPDVDARTNELQRIAMEQSRVPVPLLFAYDVIHGYRTIFPIPLGMAATWDRQAVERAAAISVEGLQAELRVTGTPR